MRQRQLFGFWLPLCASWLLMAVEGPLLSAVINRLPDEVTMLAALGITFSLAVTIESPIIGLLSTATALVRDRGSYLQVRRFTLHASLLLTLLGAAVALTPLFSWVVVDVLGTPEGIARWVRPGLTILIPWTAAIAWRRFLQGVLIRFGRPRAVARGTAIRLFSMVATAFGLAAWSQWPGIHIAATALLVGVTVEAIYATWVVRPILAQLPEVDPEARPLTYRRLVAFHLPLAGTSVLALMGQPLVTFTLARLHNPEVSLAAWPLVFHATFVLRAGGMALPEVVIALAGQDGALPALRTFGRRLGVGASTLMGLLVATPLVDLYLGTMLDTTAEVAAVARLGLALMVPLPAIFTLVAWQRGLLIHQERTRVVNEGMALQLTVIAACLGLGLWAQWPGIVTAAIAFNVAIAVQCGFLALRRR